VSKNGRRFLERIVLSLRIDLRNPPVRGAFLVQASEKQSSTLSNRPQILNGNDYREVSNIQQRSLANRAMEKMLDAGQIVRYLFTSIVNECGSLTLSGRLPLVVNRIAAPCDET
jgi:hypothetical protein